MYDKRRSFYVLFHFLHFRFFFFEICPEQSEKTHINIGYPDQGKPGDQISTPSIKQQLIMGNQKKNDGYIVAETILAGKYIEKLPL